MSANASPKAKPSPMLGQARLIRAAYDGSDMGALARQILSQYHDGEIEAGAALDLSTILLLSQRSVEALECQAQVLGESRYFSLYSNLETATTRVLIIATAGDLMANTPADFLLCHPDFSVEYYYILSEHDVPHELPDHDVLVLGIAYSAASEPLLKAISFACKRWSRPLINHPDGVLKTSRHGIANLLHDADGVLAPTVISLKKSEFIAGNYLLPSNLHFPILVRPYDTHAGVGLYKIDSLEALDLYFHQTSHEFIYMTQFFDYKNEDNLYRKYRIALVDGTPYLCHMAVRDQWMIHYLNADMSNSTAKRAEEAMAMAEFDLVFASRHRAAFAEIHRRTGIDYLVIDCSESPDGQLLVFEADTGMIVHDMDDVKTFPYKAPQMRKLFSAFQNAIQIRQREYVQA